MYRRFRSSLVPAFALLAIGAGCSDPDAALPSQEPAQGRVDQPADFNAEMAALRRATARFENFAQAQAAGYTERITPCWAHHTAGAMGYHYANTALLDATVDLLAPEVLMYEPQPGGHLKLVGREYIVPLAAWAEAGRTAPPELVGQTFTPHSSLPIYKLHIWLWRNNPDGTFKDWNPKVSCASADETEVFN